MLVTEDTIQAKNMLNAFVLPQKNTMARVLIVDDEADIRFALARILRLEGYIAEEAKSGVAALQLLEENAYDLIVLDMRMPGLSGLEVMERMRQMCPDLLIVILTGQATLESAIAATKSDGVVDYLVKPASNEQFVGAVARALQKRAKRLRQQNLVKAATQMLSAIHHPEIASGSAPRVEARSPASSLSLKLNTERFIHASPLTLDRQKRLITVTDDLSHVVELTKGEAAILACLMLHPNQILSCYELVTNALGYKMGPNESEAESVIRPYIFRLRRKLEANPKTPRLICTVRRKGYHFASPAT